jgi:hypothetical protein
MIREIRYKGTIWMFPVACMGKVFCTPLWKEKPDRKIPI